MKQHDLVVDDVVVGTEHTAAIRPCFERLPQRQRAVVERHRVACPATGVSLDVHPRCKVRAFDFDWAAVGATGRNVGSNPLRTEMGQRSERRDLAWRTTQHPHEQIQVVAALGEDHRTAAVGAAPVAAHEAMREVPVDEVFVPLERHQVAQSAGDDQVIDGAEERRVPQHVADLEDAAVALGGPHQLDAFLWSHGHGLLQQEVVAGLE